MIDFLDFLLGDAEIQRLEAENRRLRAALAEERVRHYGSPEALRIAQEAAARHKPGKARTGAAANGQAQETDAAPWWARESKIRDVDKPGLEKRLP